MPIYLFQLSDRVYTSRSTDTLIMLSVVVGGAIVAHVFLDMMRRFILMRVAVETEAKLGAPVLSAAAKASQNGSNREFQMLGDLQHLRSFITGPVILMMMDAPVAPVYLAATFLIHPDLGWIVAGTGAILFVIAHHQPEAHRRSLHAGQHIRHARQSRGRCDGAQFAGHQCHGHDPRRRADLGPRNASSLKAQVAAQDRNIYMTGLVEARPPLYANWQFSAGARACRCMTKSPAAWSSPPRSSAAARCRRSKAPSRAGAASSRPASAYARIKTLLQNSPLNWERLRLPKARGSPHRRAHSVCAAAAQRR